MHRSLQRSISSHVSHAFNEIDIYISSWVFFFLTFEKEKTLSSLSFPLPLPLNLHQDINTDIQSQLTT